MTITSMLLFLWWHGAAVASHSLMPVEGDHAADADNFRNLSKHRLGGPRMGGRGDDTLTEIQPRIVGGEESKQGDFPYFVDMLWCGGVLIAPEVVLSAAHCQSYVDQDVLISGYEWATESSGAIRATVVDEVIHPQFDPRNLDNDFYLHRLDSKVNLKSDIALRLNEDDSVPTSGQGLTVMGLGFTEEGGKRPERLNDVEVQFISNKDCNVILNGEISDNMFCAGVDGGGKDACNGDSGAPIIIRENGVHTVVGLVSWGYGCAQPNAPGVYSRISTAMEWIKEVVCDEWDVEASFCSDSSTTSPTSQPSAAADLTQPSTDTTKDLATSAPTTANTTDSNSTDCAELQVQLRTDRWPSENSLTITEVGVLASIVRNSTSPVDSLILLNITASDLESSTAYQWDLCIDSDSNQTCTVLNFTDIIGDGLADTGNLLVTLDGEVVYDEWDLGLGTVLEFGAGCLED